MEPLAPPVMKRLVNTHKDDRVPVDVLVVALGIAGNVNIRAEQFAALLVQQVGYPRTSHEALKIEDARARLLSACSREPEPWKRARLANLAAALQHLAHPYAQQGAGNGNGYGFVDPTGITRPSGEPTGPQLASAASTQVALALTGRALDRLQSLADIAPFLVTASNTAGAYLKSAYLMAAAARIVSSRVLALKAQAYGIQGAARLATVGSDLPADVSRVFQQAAADVSSYVGASKEAQAVVALLRSHANVTIIQQRQVLTKAATPLEQVKHLPAKIDAGAQAAGEGLGAGLKWLGYGLAALALGGGAWWLYTRGRRAG